MRQVHHFAPRLGIVLVERDWRPEGDERTRLIADGIAHHLGDFTRAGGFIAPGDEFTYTWEATPDLSGGD